MYKTNEQANSKFWKVFYFRMKNEQFFTLLISRYPEYNAGHLRKCTPLNFSITLFLLGKYCLPKRNFNSIGKVIFQEPGGPPSMGSHRVGHD